MIRRNQRREVIDIAFNIFREQNELLFEYLTRVADLSHDNLIRRGRAGDGQPGSNDPDQRGYKSTHLGMPHNGSPISGEPR